MHLKSSAHASPIDADNAPAARPGDLDDVSSPHSYYSSQLDSHHERDGSRLTVAICGQNLSSRSSASETIAARVTKLTKAGVAYANGKQYEDAVRAFQEAMNLHPSFSEGHYNLGILYNRLRLYREAAQSFTVVTQLRPDYAEAYAGAGPIPD